MADSVRLQIADAVATRLASATVTVNAVVRTKPTGLTAHRWRNRPITADQLPAIVVSFDTSPKPRPEATGTTDRVLSLILEHRVEVTGSTPPDDAVDPLINWAVLALMSGETLGGLATKIEEGTIAWESAEAGAAYMRAASGFDVHYITKENDPEAQP